MKMFASMCAVLVAAVIGWVGIGNHGSSSSATINRKAVPQTAASLYATYCAKCHGADGKAGTPQGKSTGAQDFTSARWKSRTSLEDAAATIRDGYQDMPSYKKRLTAAQIQSLAQYTKSFPH